MTITRREDGLYTSGIVYIRVNSVKVPVSATPYVGKTVAEVISQAVGNAQVAMWRRLLVSKMRVRV